MAVMAFVVLAECATATPIYFSGVITTATPGGYQVAAGDSFTGYLDYDPLLYPGTRNGFGAAGLTIDTPIGPSSIVFYYPNSTLSMSPGSFDIFGNPTDFFGELNLLVDANLVPIGGNFFLNSEPGKNNGNFTGAIHIPESAATLSLLTVGLLALVWFHCKTRGHRSLAKISHSGRGAEELPQFDE